MTFHIAVNGVQKEPVSEETLHSMITQGSLSADVLCWRDGWADWRPVAQAFPDRFTLVREGVVTTEPAPVQIPTLNPSQEQEAVRNTYLKHEASVQAVGSLYLLGAIILTLAGAATLAGLTAEPGKTSAQDAVTSQVVGVLFIGLGLLQLRVGLWLRKLNPKARTPATVLSAIGLLGFPIGTLVNTYVLYLLRSKKGEMVPSSYYQDVISATPHIKYKTPVIVWVLLGLLVVLLILGISAAAISNH